MRDGNDDDGGGRVYEQRARGMRAVAISGRSGSRHGGFAQPRGQVVVESHTPPQGYPRARGGVSLGCPCRGQGTITVMGTPFAEDTHLGCKLGTLGPVAAMILSPEEALCVLPSHTPDVVPLTMTNNFHDVATHALEFHYRYPRWWRLCSPSAPRRRRHVHRRLARTSIRASSPTVAWARSSSPRTRSRRASSASDAAVAAGVRSRWRGGWCRRRHRGRSRGSGRVVPLPGAGGGDGVTPAGRRRRGRHARARSSVTI